MTLKVAIIHLTSYGFPHPGRERFKRVTKEAWRFLPGSTLYGTLAAALMRLDCRQAEKSQVISIDMDKCAECLDPESIRGNGCGYLALLREIEAGRWRCSPLVPTTWGAEDSGYTAVEYSREAAAGGCRLGISPRAPLGRHSGAIFGDRLHGLVVHQPFLSYRGFVLATPDFIGNYLKRALRALPFFPFGGGRGKFTQVEAAVVEELSPEQFCPDQDIPPDRDNSPAQMTLLSPSLNPDYGLIQSLENFRPRSYTFWRTGLYWDCLDGSSVAKPPPAHYGEAGVPSHLTRPRPGLAEGAVLTLKDRSAHNLKKLFLHGLGAPEFTYLGWGQVIFKE
jgi:hypothetical protein